MVALPFSYLMLAELRSVERKNGFVAFVALVFAAFTLAAGLPHHHAEDARASSHTAATASGEVVTHSGAHDHAHVECPLCAWQATPLLPAAFVRVAAAPQVFVPDPLVFAPRTAAFRSAPAPCRRPRGPPPVRAFCRAAAVV